MAYLQQVVADNELIVPQSVEQSDRSKCVTSKVPQSVANCYRPQVVEDNGCGAYLPQVVADNGVVVQQLADLNRNKIIQQLVGILVRVLWEYQ